MTNNLNGKWKMNTSISECFNIGSVVVCRTCYRKEIEGEVLAFDAQRKILILKCSADNGRVSSCDINFINLNYVSDVQVIKESNAVRLAPHSLNIQMLNKRLKNNVEEKKRLISALQSGVSPEGQKLYLTITKTIHDVKWDGPVIVVYNQIKITPPYAPENVGSVDSKAYTYIRKMVEKYFKDAQFAKKEVQTTNNNICVSINSTNSSNHNNICAASVSH